MGGDDATLCKDARLGLPASLGGAHLAGQGSGPVLQGPRPGMGQHLE